MASIEQAFVLLPTSGRDEKAAFGPVRGGSSGREAWMCRAERSVAPLFSENTGAHYVCHSDGNRPLCEG